MTQWSGTKMPTLVVSIILAISLLIICIVKLYAQTTTQIIEFSGKEFGKISGNTNGMQENKNIHNYDLTREDSLLVFLHIQKTGGTTFGKHLLKDMEGFSCPCTLRNRHKQRHCQCYHPSNHQLWYFSRYTRGWACGVHPDYTTLRYCLPNLLESRTEENKSVSITAPVTVKSHVHPNYLYVTLLREPIQRYLSEYRHIKIGAKWPVREVQCMNGKFYLDPNPMRQHSPSRCFPEGAIVWTGVTLEEFMECELNPAANRMTKMLADLTNVSCNTDLLNNKTRTDEVMLESAKFNLQTFAYFGLTEFQRESQDIFEKTFKISFSKEFGQQETNASKMNLTSETLIRIQRINYLDVELYRWARELFLSRFG